MAPKVYIFVKSPPCRAVLMVAKAVGIKLDCEKVDTRDSLMTPDMLKLNPQHTLPILVDDDFVIWDSHAIAGYLVGEYAEDDSLYPRDLRERALVDQRLHFENGVLFTRILQHLAPVVRGTGQITKEAIESILEAYGFLEVFLDGRTWLAGDNVTIADLSILPNVATLELFIPIEESEFPLLSAWLNRGKELPYFEETNREGLDLLEGLIVANSLSP